GTWRLGPGIGPDHVGDRGAQELFDGVGKALANVDGRGRIGVHLHRLVVVEDSSAGDAAGLVRHHLVDEPLVDLEGRRSLWYLALAGVLQLMADHGGEIGFGPGLT